MKLQNLFIYLLTLCNVDYKTLAAYALIKIDYPPPPSSSPSSPLLSPPQNVCNGGNSLFYKGFSQMFFKGGMWKTSKWGETFIRHLWYLVVMTEIKIQSSAVIVK